MAVMTEAQVLGAEIERVLPDVPVAFDRDSTFYSQIEKRPVEVISGRDMRCPIELTPGGYTRGYNSDGGSLGPGSGPTYDKAVVNTVDLAHVVSWTTRSQWVTDDRRKAVINNFRRLLANQMAQFRRDIDSLISFGDGNASLGTTAAAVSVGGINAATDSLQLSVNPTTGTIYDGFGAHNVRQGLRVDFWASDWSAKVNTNPVEITYWDIKNKIIGFATGTSGGPSAGAHVVMEGFPGSPPVSLFGVAYHHNDSSTGTWLGFDRSQTPQIVANSVNANSNPLALPYPRLALNLIGDRLGLKERGQRTQAWTHPAQQQAYEELGFGISQIVKSAKEEALDLYFSENMRMAGAPVKVSYSWDRTRIDFVDLDLWGRAELHKPGFYEVDGKRIFEARAGDGSVAASMTFHLVSSFNTFVKLPAGCSYVKSLLYPTGY